MALFEWGPPEWIRNILTSELVNSLAPLTIPTTSPLAPSWPVQPPPQAPAGHYYGHWLDREFERFLEDIAHPHDDYIRRRGVRDIRFRACLLDYSREVEFVLSFGERHFAYRANLSEVSRHSFGALLQQAGVTRDIERRFHEFYRHWVRTRGYRRTDAYNRTGRYNPYEEIIGYPAPEYQAEDLWNSLQAQADLRFQAQAELRLNAENRSICLLRQHLSIVQLLSFDKNGWFPVIGCHTGKEYKILRGSTFNVRVDGFALCFQPAGCPSVGDTMLAQKIALETAEDAAIAVANVQSVTNSLQILFPTPLTQNMG